MKINKINKKNAFHSVNRFGRWKSKIKIWKSKSILCSHAKMNQKI